MTFAPAASGTRSALITIVSNGTDSPQTIAGKRQRPQRGRRRHRAAARRRRWRSSTTTPRSITTSSRRSPTRSPSSTTARSSAGRARDARSRSITTRGSRAECGVPLLQHGVRSEELALLHAGRGRVHGREGEPRLAVRRRGVLRGDAGRSTARARAAPAPSTASTTTARARRQTIASPPSSRCARR